LESGKHSKATIFLGEEGKHAPFIRKISQEALAEMVGTTRARVSFFIDA
jgi:CRP/FNR family transcriptional regulator, cyclic AMP receptor protein